MKAFSFLVSFFLITIVFGQSQSPQLLKKLEGFSHPESVVKGADTILYVSNIGNKEPGDGFISKVSENGEIIKLKWITGLNDPKGLLLENDRLYVTDNKELVIMDIATAAVIEKITVEKARSLNDITADEAGNIYISDIGKSSIFKRNPSGNITEWMSSNELNSPNGVLALGDKLIVGSWGEDKDGNLLSVNVNSKQVKKITEEGIGNLDGVQKINDSEFYVSDWATGKIYRINVNGNKTEVLTSAKSAGDILYLDIKNELVLPMNHQNSVWWYQL